jgi:nitrogenase molybdenum-iron protein alpha/beta subunit
VAVVTTCVPAVLGEDIRAILSEHDVILVDSPGFSGSFEAGYKVALSALKPATDPEIPGVTVDGLSLFDPFYQGNILEMKRLLALAGVSSYTLLCADRFSNLRHVSANTISTNEDLASGIGTSLGTVLGFDCIQETFEAIGRLSDTADPDPVIHEIVHAEERLVSACDKYLRRFDPPAVAVFSGFSYASFAARCIEKYLDAEIACIGSRTDLLRPLPWRSEKVMGLTEVEELIRVHQPDLVIGSSFERSVKGPAGFVGLTPPLRGTVRLSSRPVIGTEGVLTLMESVLNACMDRRIQSR